MTTTTAPDSYYVDMTCAQTRVTDTLEGVTKIATSGSTVGSAPKTSRRRFWGR